MIFWIDAQLSPNLAPWITTTFGYECYSAKYLNLKDASDQTIFRQAREANVIVITKDEDFVNLLNQYGSPPKVLWLTCGNTANQKLKEIFELHFRQAVKLLETADLVEITN